MLQSECLECRRIYNKVQNGKRIVETTHGICPECLEKIKEFRKSERERKRKEDIERYGGK